MDSLRTLHESAKIAINFVLCFFFPVRTARAVYVVVVSLQVVCVSDPCVLVSPAHKVQEAYGISALARELG